ncbi:hypothetical protein [Arthrobacter sp. BPSS-3]|uniref:hypothetical protein n=1 Tax=Arthrobacter sp. BPSS-3 TaxID=3366580 RepID=UPI0037DDBCEE
MAPERGRIIEACTDLTPGVDVQVWEQDRVVHRGRVSQVVPSMGMVWIIDARNGARRLVDTSEYDVVRLTGAAEPPWTQPDDAA